MKIRRNEMAVSGAAMLALLAGLVHIGGTQALAEGIGDAPLDSFDFYGILRDFRSDHPDFGLDSSAAPGNYAGNVQFFSDGDSKPVFIGVGQEIMTPWKDVKGRPIAPHLFNFSGYNAWPEGTGVYATGSITMSQGGTIDSFNSELGTYATTQDTNALIGVQSTDPGAIDINHDASIGGSVLVGPEGDPDAVVDTSGTIAGGGITGDSGTLSNAPDPLVVKVPDLGESFGDVTVNSNQILNKSIHVDKFYVNDNATLRIEGDVEIVCSDRMTIGQGAKIELADDATLRIYSLNDVKAVSQGALVNANTQDPKKVTFFHLSGLDFHVSQYTEVYATIYAPGAQVYIQQNADVYGRVLADRIDIGQEGELHIDEALLVPTDACGLNIGDVPGTAAGTHFGAITEDRTFRQWFRTLPTVNAAKLDYITLVNNGGVYEFETTDMTIADGDLLGHEGLANNRNYTMEFGAIAEYNECAGQFFEFTGDGDAWLMINDKLVIDLGGMGSGKTQFADLDRLGMYEGELYMLRFFYAQRTNTASSFKLRTNANLLYSRGVIPDSSGLYD